MDRSASCRAIRLGAWCTGRARRECSIYAGALRRARDELRGRYEPRGGLRAGGGALGGRDAGAAEPKAQRALVQAEDASRLALIAVGQRERTQEDLLLHVAQGRSVRDGM